jgi:hypothetical protein
MRAREFIKEGRRSVIDHSYEHVSPGAVTSGNKDNFYDNRLYDSYRLGMMTGMHPDDLEKSDIHSWASNMPLYASYTPEEHEKITRAMKKMGHTVKHQAYQGSREPPDVHKTSPVTGFKGYR